jgi:hypothetical protein
VQVLRISATTDSRERAVPGSALRAAGLLPAGKQMQIGLNISRQPGVWAFVTKSDPHETAASSSGSAVESRWPFRRAPVGKSNGRQFHRR